MPIIGRKSVIRKRRVTITTKDGEKITLEPKRDEEVCQKILRKPGFHRFKK